MIKSLLVIVSLYFCVVYSQQIYNLPRQVTVTEIFEDVVVNGNLNPVSKIEDAFAFDNSYKIWIPFNAILFNITETYLTGPSTRYTLSQTTVPCSKSLPSDTFNLLRCRYETLSGVDINNGLIRGPTLKTGRYVYITFSRYYDEDFNKTTPYQFKISIPKCVSSTEISFNQAYINQSTSAKVKFASCVNNTVIDVGVENPITESSSNLRLFSFTVNESYVGANITVSTTVPVGRVSISNGIPQSYNYGDNILTQRTTTNGVSNGGVYTYTLYIDIVARGDWYLSIEQNASSTYQGSIKVSTYNPCNQTQYFFGQQYCQNNVTKFVTNDYYTIDQIKVPVLGRYYVLNFTSDITYAKIHFASVANAGFFALSTYTWEYSPEQSTSVANAGSIRITMTANDFYSRDVSYVIGVSGQSNTYNYLVNITTTYPNPSPSVTTSSLSTTASSMSTTSSSVSTTASSASTTASSASTTSSNNGVTTNSNPAVTGDSTSTSTSDEDSSAFTLSASVTLSLILLLIALLN